MDFKKLEPFMAGEMVYLVIDHWNNREVSLYPCIQKPEVDPLQVSCNNSYTTLKLAYYCVNLNDNVTITHHSIEK